MAKDSKDKALQMAKKEPSPLKKMKTSGKVCRFGHCTYSPSSNGYCSNHQK